MIASAMTARPIEKVLILPLLMSTVVLPRLPNSMSTAIKSIPNINRVFVSGISISTSLSGYLFIRLHTSRFLRPSIQKIRPPVTEYLFNEKRQFHGGVKENGEID